MRRAIPVCRICGRSSATQASTLSSLTPTRSLYFCGPKEEPKKDVKTLQSSGSPGPNPSYSQFSSTPRPRTLSPAISEHVSTTSKKLREHDTRASTLWQHHFKETSTPKHYTADSGAPSTPRRHRVHTLGELSTLACSTHLHILTRSVSLSGTSPTPDGQRGVFDLTERYSGTVALYSIG
jgi:hypothetical protein